LSSSAINCAGLSFQHSQGEFLAQADSQPPIPIGLCGTAGTMAEMVVQVLKMEDWDTFY